MRWKVTAETAAPIIPGGENGAMAMAIRNMSGYHGATARIDFIRAAADELDGRQNRGLSNEKPSDNTEFDRSIAQGINRKPRVSEEVFSLELPHTVRRAVINLKKNIEGRVFANVMQVPAVDMLSGRLQ